MRGRHSKFLAIATAGLLVVAGCEPAEDDPDPTPAPGAEAPAAQQPTGQQQALTPPEGATQEQVDQGRQLFSGQGGCHACHGPQARGTQLAPDLTDGEWVNLESPNMETVVALIRTGVAEPIEHPAPMPPMGGANLSDDQVQALAAYVLALNRG